MQVICLGGPCDGLEIELPLHQDVYRPIAGSRPLYIRLHQSADRTYAYFAFSDLSRLEANELVMEHIRGRNPHALKGKVTGTAGGKAAGNSITMS